MARNQSIIEDVARGWFGEFGHGPHLAPGEPAAERDGFGDVVLVGRRRDSIARLNPAVPADAREGALRKVLRVGTPSLTQTNRAFHRMLRDGILVKFRTLATLQDTLLPKLLSGEMSVGEMNTKVEAAV